MKKQAGTSERRIEWIDAGKGIAILFVVLGHTSIPTKAMEYIYSFHIPMFFLLAGYLSGLKAPGRFPGFLKKKARNLLVPYCVFYAVIYIYFFFIGSKYGETTGVNLWLPIEGFFYSSSDNLKDLFRPMWFLPCLFVVSIAFFWIRRIGNRAGIIAVLALCSVLGYLSSLYLKPFRLPWSTDTAFTTVVFYGIGCLLAERKIGERFVHNHWRVLLAPIFLAANFGLSRLNGGVTLLSNHYGNYFYFYVSALAGTFGYILLAMLIKRLRPLCWLGRNSLIIFALHAMTIGMIRGVLVVVLGFQAASMRNSLLWGVAFTFAAALLLVPVVYVLNRYLPFLLGKKRAEPAGGSTDGK